MSWSHGIWAGVLGWTTMAAGMPCRYDGSQFRVTWNGVEHRQAVARDFPQAKVACGSEVAALYDGNDFVVFDPSRGGFVHRSAAHNYDAAQLKVNGSWAGLYDGDRIWAYNRTEGFVDEKANSFRYTQITMGRGRLAFYDGDALWNFDGKRWSSHAVRHNYRHTRLEASSRFVVLYDGDDLWVWEGGASDPVSTPVKYQFYFPVVLVGDEALGFYDGARLHGFCRNHGFTSTPAAFDPYAKGRLHKSGDIEMVIQGVTHRLEAATCQWR